jgi:hypothetical protein
MEHANENHTNENHMEETKNKHFIHVQVLVPKDKVREIREVAIDFSKESIQGPPKKNFFNHCLDQLNSLHFKAKIKFVLFKRGIWKFKRIVWKLKMS